VWQYLYNNKRYTAELLFTTAYCLSSASQLKIFSLTVSLNEILVSNTGIGNSVGIGGPSSSQSIVSSNKKTVVQCQQYLAVLNAIMKVDQ